MFVGHYAAAFALKGKEKTASLAMLFIATQFVDILFFPLAVAGVENLKFVEGFTAVNDFNMDHYPYTHGLLGTVVWALIFYCLYYLFYAKKQTNRKTIAIVMALGVLSHWFADLIVHTPDLPLICGEPKFGFGLWHSKEMTFGIEGLLLVLSWYYYMIKTQSNSKKGKYLSLAFVIFLIGLNFLNLYVLPPNHDLVSLTVSALVFYFLLAVMAHYVERVRV